MLYSAYESTPTLQWVIRLTISQSIEGVLNERTSALQDALKTLYQAAFSGYTFSLVDA